MNIAVVLCGGRGVRMNSALPKQLIKINNRPLFLYTLDSFFAVKEIDRVILVVEKKYLSMYQDALSQEHYSKKIEYVFGGTTRQLSVENAISYLDATCNEDDIVLIHDGARVLIAPETIKSNIDNCNETNLVVSTIIKVVDTVVDDNYRLLEREKLLLMQTPQTFKYHVLKNIHFIVNLEGITNASDDIQLAKKYGYKITNVNGSRTNIKITEKDDLKFVELYLAKKVM